MAAKRRLTADSEQIAGLRQDRQQQRQRADRGQVADSARVCDRNTGRNGSGDPPSAPDQVFFGLTRGHKGSANSTADEIGRDVGRPHHGEQK